MPVKSRKSSQASYQRRKAARQKLLARTKTSTQPAQSESTAKVAAITASAVQVSTAGRFSISNEMRRISIIGSSIIVILIIMSLILRYAINNP